jgi:hypothetical protein
VLDDFVALALHGGDVLDYRASDQPARTPAVTGTSAAASLAERERIHRT